MRLFRFVFFVLFAPIFACAQQFTVSGQLTDRSDSTALAGAGVVLVYMQDTLIKPGTATDADGNFSIVVKTPGDYLLRTQYIGYANLERRIQVETETQALGRLWVEPLAIALKDVIVQGRQIRAVQKGDTTEYNAAAYKVNPDATVQDLVTKMPGIALENGTLKAQGEAVQKVLIDGKEFFGDDATIALKNLPAEIVDKIQVFNRLSEQSQFTGIDDGNTQKTLNITTKEGRNNGVFGRVSAGYGTIDRYLAGGNVNAFKGERKISVIGLANNVNQQNFAAQDLVGTSSGGGGGSRGQGGGGGGNRGGSGGNSSNNFLVGPQGGINTTRSLGLNYSNSWKKKLTLTGSYFVNNTLNTTTSNLQRQYFLSENRTQLYDQQSSAESNNLNHRLNARLEYKIDSANSILLLPKLSYQDNSSASHLNGLTSTGLLNLLNQTLTGNTSNSNGLNFSNNLQLRHKFAKRGRTLSLDIGTGINRTVSENLLRSQNFFFLTDSVADLNQRADLTSAGNTHTSNLQYTEPVGQKGILSFNYSPSYNRNESDKRTNRFDPFANSYTIQDSILSNSYENTILTQRGGLGYRLKSKKYNVMAGINYQDVQLKGEQTFPLQRITEKSFRNVLPNAMLQYNFTKADALRLYYRSSTDVPSVSQLQNVINNSNPLQLTTGNPELQQEFTHNLAIRYNRSNSAKARTFMALLNGTYTLDYIGTSTLIATSPIELQQGIVLNRGAQLTRPLNLDGYYNASSFVNYGLPADLIRCNLNLSAGLSYQKMPSLINSVLNNATTYNMNGGLVAASNISEKVDFTLSCIGNYNIVNNTLQPQLNNNYYYQVSGLKLNWITWKGIVVNSEWNYTFYNGLGGGYNRQYLLWNAAVGYKFLKNKAGELRLSVFDLLKQNNSISRTVTGNYIEDNQTKVLTQYFMLSFNYTIRKFAVAK